MTNDLFNMRVTPEFLRCVDELRRKEEDIPNRSEMVRRCVMIVAQMRGAVEKERTGGKRK